MFTCFRRCLNYMKILPLFSIKRPDMSEKRILTVFALLVALLLPGTLKAQVPVEVSGEKIVLGGKVYYMHNVQKGQTLYSISRAYKVTIDVITRENVIPASGIQTGQVLRIPEVPGVAAAPSQPRQPVQPAQRPPAAASATPAASQAAAPAVDPATGIKLAKERIMYNGKPYFMHEVLKGQTLYSIARAYRVTILDIDRENAIPAGGLQAGQILRIPAASSLVVQEEVVPQAGAGTEKPATAAQPKSTLPAAEKPKPAQTQQAEPTATQPSRQDAAAAKPTATQPSSQDAAAAKTTTTQPEQTAQAATSTSKPATKPAPPEKKKIHKVQKGESLADIAKKYDITVQELKSANKGVIFAMPDMRLVIPVKEEQE